MSYADPRELELLKSVLEPLLEDFQYWFSRAQRLLEAERLPFLSQEAQTSLLERVKRSQEEVSAAKILFNATGGQAGIDTAVLVLWHGLVAEYWQVAMQWRTFKAESSKFA